VQGNFLAASSAGCMAADIFRLITQQMIVNFDYGDMSFSELQNDISS
jgi:hypothetical protein